MRYVVELLGHNDGLPYEEYVTTSKKEAKDVLDRLVHDQPKVAHRLIIILEERERIA